MLRTSNYPIDFGKFSKVLLIITVLAVPPSPTNNIGFLILISFLRKNSYLNVYSVGTNILLNAPSSGGTYSIFVQGTQVLVPNKSKL